MPGGIFREKASSRMLPSVSFTSTPRASWKFAFGSASTASTGISPASMNARTRRELIVVLPVPPFPESAMVNGRMVMVPDLYNPFREVLPLSGSSWRSRHAARWISPAPFRSANRIPQLGVIKRRASKSSTGIRFVIWVRIAQYRAYSESTVSPEKSLVFGRDDPPCNNPSPFHVRPDRVGIKEEFCCGRIGVKGDYRGVETDDKTPVCVRAAVDAKPAPDEGRNILPAGSYGPRSSGTTEDPSEAK